MAEPWEEQVAATIKANLESIRGGNGIAIGEDGYWYTPDVVERALTIEGHGLLTDEYETIYAIAPETETIVEVEIDKGVEKILTFDFLLARRHPHTDEVYHQKEPTRWQVQNRLWHDFKKKIFDDYQLGGLTDNINFDEVNFSAEATWVPGWAIVIGQIMPTVVDAADEDED